MQPVRILFRCLEEVLHVTRRLEVMGNHRHVSADGATHTLDVWL